MNSWGSTSEKPMSTKIRICLFYYYRHIALVIPVVSSIIIRWRLNCLEPKLGLKWLDVKTESGKQRHLVVGVVVFILRTLNTNLKEDQL